MSNYIHSSDIFFFFFYSDFPTVQGPGANSGRVLQSKTHNLGRYVEEITFNPRLEKDMNGLIVKTHSWVPAPQSSVLAEEVVRVKLTSYILNATGMGLVR